MTSPFEIESKSCANRSCLAHGEVKGGDFDEADEDFDD